MPRTPTQCMTEGLKNFKRALASSTPSNKKTSFENAIKAFQYALQKSSSEQCKAADKLDDAKTALSHDYIAICNLKLDQPAEAIKSFFYSQQVDPDNQKYSLAGFTDIDYFHHAGEGSFIIAQRTPSLAHAKLMYFNAITAFEKAIELRATSPNPLTPLKIAKIFDDVATCYSIIKNYSEALKHIDLAISNNPAEPLYRTHKGDILYDSVNRPNHKDAKPEELHEAKVDYEVETTEQKINNSLKVYEAAIQLTIEQGKGGGWEAFKGKATCLTLLERYEEAEAVYKDFIQNNPLDTKDSYANLGFIYYQKSKDTEATKESAEADLKQALQYYELQLQATPNNLTCLLYKCHALSNLGNAEGSFDAFHKLIDIARGVILIGNRLKLPGQDNVIILKGAIFDLVRDIKKIGEDFAYSNANIQIESEPMTEPLTPSSSQIISAGGAAAAGFDPSFSFLTLQRESSVGSNGDTSPTSLQRADSLGSAVSKGSNTDASTDSETKQLGEKTSTETALPEHPVVTVQKQMHSNVMSMISAKLALATLIKKQKERKSSEESKLLKQKITSLEQQMADLRDLLIQTTRSLNNRVDVIEDELATLKQKVTHNANKLRINSDLIEALTKNAATDQKLNALILKELDTVMSKMSTVDQLMSKSLAEQAEHEWFESLEPKSYKQTLYHNIIRQLSEVYMAAIVVHTGIVAFGAQGAVGKVGGVLGSISQFIPIVDSAVGLFSEFLKYADEQHQREMVDYLYNLAKGQEEMHKLTTLLAKMIVNANLDRIHEEKHNIVERCMDFMEKEASEFAKSIFSISRMKDYFKGKVHKVGTMLGVIPEDNKAPPSLEEKGESDGAIVAQFIISVIYSGRIKIGETQSNVLDFLFKSVEKEFRDPTPSIPVGLSSPEVREWQPTPPGTPVASHRKIDHSSLPSSPLATRVATSDSITLNFGSPLSSGSESLQPTPSSSFDSPGAGGVLDLLKPPSSIESAEPPPQTQLAGQESGCCPKSCVIL